MQLQTQPAFSALYREHYAFVWALLRRFGVDPRDLEDVVQDVFVVVHRRLPEFEGRASVKTWLYAIAFRVALNHNRRRQRRPAQAETSSSTLPAPRLHADPEEHAVRSEAGDLLDELLGKLDPDKRAVFVLSEIEGLPAPEIARIVGAKTRTVYSRLRAARDRFTTDLQRTHARDRRWQARELVRRARADERPSEASRRRVWAALLVRLGSTEAVAGAVGAATAAKASGLAVGLAAVGLGLVFVATAPMRDASSDTSIAGDQRVTPPRAQPSSSPPPQVAVASAPNRPESPPLRSDTAASAHDVRPPATKAVRSVSEDAPVDPLAAELELMQRARAALAADDAERAARLLGEHARRHPDGVFAHERQRSLVTALCRLGRSDAAVAQAAKLEGVSAPCSR